jgi:4-carboxymuconolactone decarboxylase
MIALLCFPKHGGYMMDPRIPPLEPPYDPETAAMLEKWMPPGTGLEPLTLFRTLTVHDELSARMRPLGAGILGHGRVGARERELMILRTCARAGAEYEWGVHATAFGAGVGLSADEIAATAAGEPSEDLIVRLADELYETNDVSDELWKLLAEQYANDQLLELIVTAGWYRLLSYVINAARIPLEPWAARFPEQAAQPER